MMTEAEMTAEAMEKISRSFEHYRTPAEKRRKCGTCNKLTLFEQCAECHIKSIEGDPMFSGPNQICSEE